jgi:hypothetical protein
MVDKIVSAHIGDGVYVSFDGYQINLAVNHHTNHAVSLEPEVFAELVLYARAVNKHYGVDHFTFPEHP